MKKYSKRILSFFLMVCMMITAIPLEVFADTFTPDGKEYSFEYVLNGDGTTVSITGITVPESLAETELAVEIPSAIDGKTVTKIEGSS